MSSDHDKTTVQKVPPALRLQASRERLRDAMTPPPEPPAPPPAPPNAVQKWLKSLSAVPVVGEVAEAVGSWWVRHPLRPVVRMANEAATAAAQPVALRHPALLMSGSAAVGALLVLSKPWRWALRSALFAGLVPQLASKVISKLPMRSWLTMLGTVAGSAGNRPSPVSTSSSYAVSTAPTVSSPVFGSSSPAL